jgi:hypothetical protein
MSGNAFELAMQQAASELHGANMTQFGWLMNEQPPTFVNASATPKSVPAAPNAPSSYQHMAHHGSIDFGHQYVDGSDLLGNNNQYQNMLAQASMMQSPSMGNGHGHNHGQMQPPQHNQASFSSAPTTEANDMMNPDPLISAQHLMKLIPGTTVTPHEVRDILSAHPLGGTFANLAPLDTLNNGHHQHIEQAPHTAPARLDDQDDGRLYRFGSDSHFGLDGFKPSSLNEKHDYIAGRLTEELHMLKPINRSNVPTRASSPSQHHRHSHSHHMTSSSSSGLGHSRKRSSAHLDGSSGATIKDEIDDTNHIARPKKRRKDEALSDDDDLTSSPAAKRKFSVPNPRLRRVSTATNPNAVGGGDLSPSSASKRRRSSVSASAAPGKTARENLSEEQKRSNHIQSEQKRRNLIKVGFEELRRIVPELRGGGLSKSMELMEVSNFMEQVIRANELLRARMGVQLGGAGG